MKIKNEILEVIKQGTLSEEGDVYYLPDIQLDRKLYVETNKVLEGLGLKWNKKEKAHISSEDVSEKWYNMIDTGEWVDVKKQYQYFPTPKEIVRQMIDMINWEGVETALEPSFGTGNILDELPSQTNIHGCEINPEMFTEVSLKYTAVENVNLLNIDFLSLEEMCFDVIIANPPFTKLQSLKHFNHMVKLLEDNGQLLCILPCGDYDKNSSIKLRQEFTKFVDDNNCSITYLDGGHFKESGTMVKTMIVKYVKSK